MNLSRSNVTGWLVLLITVLVGAPRVFGSEGPPPVLHIKTYLSPSGEYALVVDPSRLHGHGPGTYRLTRSGVEVWAGERPYTLWEAAVTDNGTVAGYAYTHGWRGMPEVPGGTWNGSFIVVILDPDGNERLHEVTERQEGGMHMPPNPVASGMFADSFTDRLVVRFSKWEGEDRGEEWGTYRLSTGEILGKKQVSAPRLEGVRGFVMPIGATAVAGTGLAVVQWSRAEYGAGEAKEGICLTLVDADGNEIWRHDWPDEFKGIEHYIPRDAERAELVPPSRESGEFVFRSYKAQSRLLFRAAKDPAQAAGWRVDAGQSAPEKVGVGRGPDQTLDAPQVALEHRGTITLARDADAAASLGHVGSFDIDDRGRMGFISAWGGEAPTFMLVDAQGDVKKRTALNIPRDEHHAAPMSAWVGGDRWVVLNYAFSLGKKADVHVWWLDVAAGTLAPIPDVVCPEPLMGRGLTGDGHGGFAVMGNWSTRELVAFDESGRRRWAYGEGFGGSPQAVAVGADGTIGVLVGIGDTIDEFAPDGARRRSINLREAVGHKPNYVADLSADADGGWIVQDFDGVPPVYRINRDGRLTAKFEPRYADGRTFRLYGGVQRAPDGTLWTSDGTALLRLTDDGKVDRVLGRAPDSQELSELRCFSTGPDGRLFAVDGRNGYVHVFDRTGKRLRVLRPKPEDFQVDTGIGSITVAGDGSVYYRPASHSRTGELYLKFDGQGDRVGFQERVLDGVSEDWYFRPGGQERLVTGYEEAYLYDAAGKRVRVIDRRADRKWLVNPGNAAVAPDGTFALIGASSGWGGETGPSVTLYRADGAAVRTLDLPGEFQFARVAFNGDVACACSGKLLVLYRMGDGAVSVFEILGASDKSWLEPFCTPDGGTLLLLDRSKMTLEQFALLNR